MLLGVPAHDSPPLIQTACRQAPTGLCLNYGCAHGAVSGGACAGARTGGLRPCLLHHGALQVIIVTREIPPGRTFAV